MADDTQARERRRGQVRRAELHAPQVAGEPSNTARFLVLCLLCALLTGAYAWFSLARSADRSNAGALPPIAGALDAEPAPTDAGAEPLAEPAAEATPAGSMPTPVAADTATSRDDAEAGKGLPDTGAPAPTDQPALFTGPAPEELTAPAAPRRIRSRATV